MNDLPPNIWADQLEDAGIDTALLRACLSYAMIPCSDGSLNWRNGYDSDFLFTMGYDHLAISPTTGLAIGEGDASQAGYGVYSWAFGTEKFGDALGYGSVHGYHTLRSPT